LSGLGSVGTFVGMTFIIALMGSEQVVGHAIGLQAANVGFAILWGGAQATTIRIGRATGARNLAATQTAAWTGVANGVATAAILGTTFLVLRDQIVGLFLDYEVAANAASIEAALSVMLAIGIYQLANGPQLVATSSLRGLRDTTVPFVISLTGYWVVGASLAAILLRFTELQAEGIWFAMSAAVALSSVILLYRLRRLLPKALELTSET
jgi:MATE family multidrug resistance protein